MKESTRTKLEEAYSWCQENDKSTEFMIEYMQDFAGVDLDCVINFLTKYHYEQEAGVSLPSDPNPSIDLTNAEKAIEIDARELFPDDAAVFFHYSDKDLWEKAFITGAKSNVTKEYWKQYFKIHGDD